MAPFESGRRLCLLVEAGEARFAIEATSVMEVAQPGADGQFQRGVLEVRDLSALLGGAPERGPGMVVVLDTSPTLAVRVREVVEVADVARAPSFLLPPGLGGLAGLSRGALVHKERLYLELAAEALPHQPGPLAGVPPRPVYLLETPPERALVLESQGRHYGLPLPLVSQVVARGQDFTSLPVQAGPVAGLFPHDQALWPVCSAPGLLGEAAGAEPFFVLTELAGQNVALAASRVVGVYPHFAPTEVRGEFSAQGLSAPALFLDLQRMFS